MPTVLALSEKNRQETWRERLQEFASKPPEEMGDEWGLFLKELGLTNDYYLAVCECSSREDGQRQSIREPT